MDEETRENFGRVVRTLREAMGMSRAELREATAACPQTDGKPISVEMIAKVEQGTRAVRGATLRKLAHGLGIATEDLSERASTRALLAGAGVGAVALRASTLLGGGALIGAVGAMATPGGLPLGAAGAVISSVREREALQGAVRARLEQLQDLGGLADRDLVALADALGARVQDDDEDQPSQRTSNPGR